jgi:ribosomal protein S18 acetylase RimI-like enzyme
MIKILYYNEIYKDSFLELLEEVRMYESAQFEGYLLNSNSYLNDYLTNKNHMILIAVVDDKVIGYMIGTHITNYAISVDILYVAKEYRSKGVALMLKKELEHLAQLRGYKQIVSQVRINNKASIALNIKAGWEQEMDKIYPDYYIWFTKNL